MEKDGVMRAGAPPVSSGVVHFLGKHSEWSTASSLYRSMWYNSGKPLPVLFFNHEEGLYHSVTVKAWQAESLRLIPRHLPLKILRWKVRWKFFTWVPGQPPPIWIGNRLILMDPRSVSTQDIFLCPYGILPLLTQCYHCLSSKVL